MLFRDKLMCNCRVSGHPSFGPVLCAKHFVPTEIGSQILDKYVDVVRVGRVSELCREFDKM
jgi:hypothetical protein